jgi:hypothetical protein
MPVVAVEVLPIPLPIMLVRVVLVAVVQVVRHSPIMELLQPDMVLVVVAEHRQEMETLHKLVEQAVRVSLSSSTRTPEVIMMFRHDNAVSEMIGAILLITNVIVAVVVAGVLRWSQPTPDQLPSHSAGISNQNSPATFYYLGNQEQWTC